jgi:hypothetical protein
MGTTLTFKQRGKIYAMLRTLPNTDLVFTWDNGDKIKIGDLTTRENGMSVYLDTRSPKALPFQHAVVLIDGLVKLAEVGNPTSAPPPDSYPGEYTRLTTAPSAELAGSKGWTKGIDPSAPSKAVRTPSVPEGWVKGRPLVGARPDAPAEVGIYVFGEAVIKVKKTKNDRNFAVEIGTTTRGHHKPIPRKGLVYKLTADMKMSAKQAKAYGDKFGVCVNCGKALSDPASVRLGMGPVCHKRLTAI